MKQNIVLSGAEYAKLVKDIRVLLEQGRSQAKNAVRNILTRTYWEIGKRASETGLMENAVYGQSILRDAAEELDIDYSTLLRAVQFFQAYNLATSSENLTWSHYKVLLPIGDEKERRWYEDLSFQRNLSVLQLREAIKEERFKNTKKKVKKSTLKKLKRPQVATYVYASKIERVIDGDTVLLRIDLGFQVWKEQRIRLAGIDCPAMDEPKGVEAYRYARDQLSKAAIIMVKTGKIDIYGRYVGNIFYSLKPRSKDKVFESGNYLNQELLDKGLARVF